MQSLDRKPRKSNHERTRAGQKIKWTENQFASSHSWLLFWLSFCVPAMVKIYFLQFLEWHIRTKRAEISMYFISHSVAFCHIERNVQIYVGSECTFVCVCMPACAKANLFPHFILYWLSCSYTIQLLLFYYRYVMTVIGLNGTLWEMYAMCVLFVDLPLCYWTNRYC